MKLTIYVVDYKPADRAKILEADNSTSQRRSSLPARLWVFTHLWLMVISSKLRQSPWSDRTRSFTARELAVDVLPNLHRINDAAGHSLEWMSS